MYCVWWSYIFADKCKLLKGSKPLLNHKFYLDIEKHHISNRIELKIKELGGVSKFFYIFLNQYTIIIIIKGVGCCVYIVKNSIEKSYNFIFFYILFRWLNVLFGLVYARGLVCMICYVQQQQQKNVFLSFCRRSHSQWFCVVLQCCCFSGLYMLIMWKYFCNCVCVSILCLCVFRTHGLVSFYPIFLSISEVLKVIILSFDLSYKCFYIIFFWLPFDYLLYKKKTWEELGSNTFLLIYIWILYNI